MEVIRSGMVGKYLAVSSVLLFAMCTGSAKTGCPANLRYTTVTEDYSGFCYQFVDKEMYWTDAQKYCLKNGGGLVMLPDRGTNDFITGTLSSLSSWKNKGVWIGLNDRNDELNWKWATNVEGSQIPMDNHWTNWASGHPKAFFHSVRDCVRMVRKDNWKWHETPCSSLRWKYKFICQYELPPATPAPTVPLPEQQYLASISQTSYSVEEQSLTHSTNTETGAVETMMGKDLVTRQTDDVITDGVVSVEQSVGATANSDRRIKLWAIGSACVGIVAFIIILLIMMFMKRRRSKTEGSSNFCSNAMYDNSDSKTDISPSARVNNVYVETSPSQVTKAVQLNNGESLHASKLESDNDYLNPTPLLNIPQLYLTTDISKPKAMNGSWKLPEEATHGEESQKTQGQIANDDIEYELPRDEHIYAEIPEKVNDW